MADVFQQISAGVLNAEKTAIEYTAGIKNIGIATLLELTDPQSKNNFEILIYPYNMTSVSWTSTFDSIVSQLYIRSITLPSISFAFEPINSKKMLKGIEYPEEVSISFLETELGTTRRYLWAWQNDIAIRKPDGEYIFNDDQLASKKNATVLLMAGSGLPAIGFVKIYGLKLKSMGEVTLSHEETEHLIIEAIFAVDSVTWEVLL